MKKNQSNNKVLLQMLRRRIHYNLLRQTLTDDTCVIVAAEAGLCTMFCTSATGTFVDGFVFCLFIA